MGSQDNEHSEFRMETEAGGNSVETFALRLFGETSFGIGFDSGFDSFGPAGSCNWKWGAADSTIHHQ